MSAKAASGTSKGIGCGTIFLVILIVICLFILGANAGIGWYSQNCEDMKLFECLDDLSSEEEPPAEKAVTATGSYSYKDYSITMTANIPLGGGKVTGSMSGDCTGKVTGSYDGKNGGAISGKVTGYCNPFFVNIPASADFRGIVNKDGKVVPISFTGRGGGLTHQGSMSLSY